MDATHLSSLNPQQRAAATHPADSPLLIIAGAGTGKTNTLAHRVAHLLSTGVAPSRLLLLTFSRRAAAEMTRRVHSILSSPHHSATPSAHHLHQIWSGTFHSIANRLLRTHAAAIGFADSFTVADRPDAEDLLNTIRTELALDKADVRFPRKETCLAVYSRCVNALAAVEDVLKAHFPWCQQFPEQLKALFKAYVARKQENNVLDYDDLLLYWSHLMADVALAADIRGRFDAVLVDEYQDTNALQARILKGLCPTGRGLTVVGDDAQSIYSFRAATVHNILDFPQAFPGAAVLKLEQNYRSVQPVLDATNAVIALCPRRYNKDLFSTRKSAQKPRLVTCVDEDQQCTHVIGRILEHREAGIPLRRQAVLFRAAHHSDALEVELARRNIPFVKYGGLKFLEAAHVKDALCFLRLAENPRDSVSAFRVLQLLDGIGPSHARRALEHLAAHAHDLSSWRSFKPPCSASEQWSALVTLFSELSTRHSALSLPDQIAAIRVFYAPILEKLYDQPASRLRDIEQLEQVASNFASRSAMLAELTLDPPNSTQDLAGPPLREEDYLILSTIHSAKGCERDVVYVIHASDGNIPSDLATGSDEEIEEERRLFYVALTRARDFLEVCFPLKYYHKKWAASDRHSYAQLTRFLPEPVLQHFERVRLQRAAHHDDAAATTAATDIRQKVSAMWG
jgi:DNA helicase-2/ATP-dependent DNA helicase PcrA